MNTWEEAAKAVADDIYYSDNRGDLDVVDRLLRLDLMIDEESMRMLGSIALDMVREGNARKLTYSKTMAGIVDTVIAKQHDYGHGNILRHGLKGVVVRMCDKVERIRNLERRAEAANESLQDSWCDLVGYSIIGIMLLNGTFELPLEQDVVAEKVVDVVPPYGPTPRIHWRGQVYDYVAGDDVFANMEPF